MNKQPTRVSNGNFGPLAKEYEATRPACPAKILSFIASNVANKQPLILDLGCGTGISTRQLAQKIKGVAIGCDVDLEMLKMAINHKQKNASYILGDARKIPFETGIFDAVTAFSAFHWFTDKAALKEIRRVLKPNGIFCTVQPRHVSAISGDFRLILQRELGREVPASYSRMDFRASLLNGGFKILQQKKFRDAPIYTLDQYLILLQSRSVWNNVPITDRKRILNILKKHFATKLENDVIHDTREIEVLIARVG